MDMINIANMSNTLVMLKGNNLINNYNSNVDTKNSSVVFSKMLSMILSENTGEQKLVNNLLVSNFDKKDLENLVQSCVEEDKSKTQYQVDYNSLMNMISGTIQNPLCTEQQNPLSTELKNSNFEISINDLVVSADQSKKLVAKISSENFEFNDKSIEYFNGIYDTKETVNTLLLKDNSLPFESFTMKNNLLSDKDVENIQKNTLDKTVSPLQNDTNIKEAKSEFSLTNRSLSRENLSTIKDKIIDNTNVDLRGSIIENKTPINVGNNKIIEISDQSSEIKNSVLSQVEDKIVFMANEKEGMQEVTMELHPKNLGKVNIKMSLESEKLTVELTALDLKTGNILGLNVHELTKSLQNNFSNGVVTVTVTEGGMNQFNQSNLDYNQHNNQGQQNNNNQKFYNNDDNFDESTIISEIINLRNLKLNKVV